MGYETIMVNCNPETVSTDFDTSDRLFFEPLTAEDVLEIVDENRGPRASSCSSAARRRSTGPRAGSGRRPDPRHLPDAIDLAEDRERFQALLQDLDLKPAGERDRHQRRRALAAAEALGYPVLVRPSYVLGGRAMEIVHDMDALTRYMEAVRVSGTSPVLLDRSQDAIEVDVDALCDADAMCMSQASWSISRKRAFIPATRLLAAALFAQRRKSSRKSAARRKFWPARSRRLGLMNVQYAVKDDEVYI